MVGYSQANVDLWIELWGITGSSAAATLMSRGGRPTVLCCNLSFFFLFFFFLFVLRRTQTCFALDLLLHLSFNPLF